jgi:hypothetical protein
VGGSGARGGGRACRAPGVGRQAGEYEGGGGRGSGAPGAARQVSGWGVVALACRCGGERLPR